MLEEGLEEGLVSPLIDKDAGSQEDSESQKLHGGDEMEAAEDLSSFTSEKPVITSTSPDNYSPDGMSDDTTFQDSIDKGIKKECKLPEVESNISNKESLRSVQGADDEGVSTGEARTATSSSSNQLVPGFTHTLSEKEAENDIDDTSRGGGGGGFHWRGVQDDDELQQSISKKERLYSLQDTRSPKSDDDDTCLSTCQDLFCQHDEDTYDRIIWWITIAFLFLIGLCGAAISFGSITCFLESWTDKRHWWPDSLATDYLDQYLCPISHINTFTTWTSRRLVLALSFIVFGIFTFISFQVVYLKIASKMREHRLEDKYPWLSRLIDGTYVDKDGSKLRMKKKANQQRQQAANKFADAFSRKMTEVHDSTLSVELSFEDMCVEGGGKKLLHKVCGGVRASRVTAFMGPSGAGKSTLLHALCGKIEVASGEVKVNGSKASMKQMTKIVGFVPQDDILLGMLTVKETLRFHAHLRLPTHVRTSSREEWVDSCIDLLGLTDVKHSIVGDENNRGISGGQRKRVNIGVELVSDPSILFLDEPTSGLDSSAALEVMRCLQIAASEGMTICCVIHQPRTSVYELFDDLLLLGRTSARYGGRTVYYGPAPEATNYFENLNFFFPPKENPADVYIDIVSGSKQPESEADGTPRAVEVNQAVARRSSRQAEEGGSSIEPLLLNSSTNNTTSIGGRGTVDNELPMMRPLADLWDEYYKKNTSRLKQVRGATMASISEGADSSGASRTMSTQRSNSEYRASARRTTSNHENLLRNTSSPSRDQDDIESNNSMRSPNHGDDSGSLLSIGPLTRSLGSDTARAYRTMESALANLSVRLRDNNGRHTPGVGVQLLLFIDRQITQLFRRSPLVLKNMIMFTVAGLVLGALYADTLSDWPDGGTGFCGNDDDDVHDDDKCSGGDDASYHSQPQLGEGDCEGRIWPGVENDMDLTYRQVFTLALLGMCLLSVQSALDLFGEERLIFRRESRHHMAWTYACGKMIAASPLAFLYPFCFTAGFHTIFNPMASFSDFYWTFMCTGVAGDGLGILLSIAFPDTRQVAGGVFALVMAMFTGCFPLFSDGGSTRSIGYFSFLRYSAQLLFRFEYLSYVGLIGKFGCAKEASYEGAKTCLEPKGFERHSFWLPPDDPEEYATFSDCPLPWDYHGEHDDQTIHIGDDAYSKSRDDDQWDLQCCSVNLFFKIKNLMLTKYGYVMHPDYSFVKLLAFSVCFRFVAIMILAWKDLSKRR